MTETWLIEPRDPLVLGNGLQDGSAVTAGTLLQPGTLAGMVRARCIADAGHVGPDEARALLEVRLRGPWLVRQDHVGGGREILVPAPRDHVVQGDRVRAARLLAPATDGSDGVYWRGIHRGPTHLVDLGEVDKQCADRVAAYWPLTAAVSLNLGSAIDVELVSTSVDRPIVRAEARSHLELDNDTGTAAPGQLFTSHGWRLGGNIGLAVEITGGTRSPQAGAVILGGESRLSFFSSDPRAAFPPFADFEADYKTALARGPRGLRLQLLTPACFHTGAPASTPAWRPPTPPALEGFTLVAARIPGFQAISGWNLQDAHGRGAPRAVRRLVPAGSVYWYACERPRDLLSVCEALWARPLDPDRELTDDERREFRAPPARDGYGLALPGLWFDDDVIPHVAPK